MPLMRVTLPDGLDAVTVVLTVSVASLNSYQVTRLVMASRPPNIQTTDFGIYNDRVSVELASPNPATPTANSLPSFHVFSSDPPQLSEKLHSSKNSTFEYVWD